MYSKETEQKWLLCDLHMHSFYSSIRKPGEKVRLKKMTAKEYVDILNKNGVELFSITDHNYFAYEYYNEIEKYILENSINMKIINGTELDVYVESGEKTKFIHLCVYFDDNVDRKKLHETIEKLYVGQNNEFLMPKLDEIIDRLMALDSKFIIIPHGNKERGIFKIIKDLSGKETEKFYQYAMYKIFNAFDVKKEFKSKEHNFWATNFFEHTKKFEQILKNYNENKLKDLKEKITSKIKGEYVLLSKEEKEIYTYIIDYGSYFAYFSFSDWHNGDEYKPETNNFIFGSLKYGFEAVELATLDPKSRIEQSKKDKQIFISDSLLKKLKFKIGDEEKEVTFSPGLNVVIGKRGSGKSLLLAIIKNLVDKNDEEGAMKKYKDLKISDIEGTNRGDIPISLGGLESVAFLHQSQINEIFENPQQAQTKIAENFKEINGLDLNGIKEICKIAKGIKPYDMNYKNVTSYITGLKKTDQYILIGNDELDYKNLAKQFDDVNNNLSNAIAELKKIGLNTEIIEKISKEVLNVKSYYLKMIDLYNEIITNVNMEIQTININKDINMQEKQKNIKTINEIINKLVETFRIQLNYEKLKIAIEKFKFENPPVEVNTKNKYLFVTYYNLPQDINDTIIEKITSTLTDVKKLDDIGNYLSGDSKKHLKMYYKDISDILEKYINSEDFKSTKEFYKINDDSINYKTEIKTQSDLEKLKNENKITNLTNASLGTRSVAYLDMLFDLDENILVLDQPEDNIDNEYISKVLVPNIKEKKKIKQLIFVTHNPSVAVYGDAFNYIYAENNDKINYSNYLIEKTEDKEKLLNILEGGRRSFSNRNQKFGNILGEEEYGNQKNQ